jgi:AcrR family transcriptional regulator
MAAPVARDETRARILAVALELIAERGFAATSTREMSERLGFTKAALYYHFRTKDDLLEALVQPALDEMEVLVEGVAPRPSPAARRELIRGFIELMGAHEDVIRVLSEDPSVRHRPPLARAEPIFRRFIQLLTGEESPDTAARTRALAALGGVQMALVNAEPDDDREVVREAAFAAACGALGLPALRRTPPA